MEATVDWGFGPTKAGAMLSELSFRQPDWPAGEGYGRMPSCRVNGEAVDFTAKWPVFDGPEMTLNESILKVKSDSETYRVDYSESVPRFSIQ